MRQSSDIWESFQTFCISVSCSCGWCLPLFSHPSIKVYNMLSLLQLFLTHSNKKLSVHVSVCMHACVLLCMWIFWCMCWCVFMWSGACVYTRSEEDARCLPLRMDLHQCPWDRVSHWTAKSNRMVASLCDLPVSVPQIQIYRSAQQYLFIFFIWVLGLNSTTHSYFCSSHTH